MTNQYIDSYYSRSLLDETTYPCLREDVQCDVCVMGGGLAGVATALELAQRGKKVILLEAKRMGWGASGRNGGFVLAGFATGIKDVVRKVGLEQAKEMYGLTQDALATIKKRIEHFQIECNPVDGEIVASWYDDEQSLKEEVAYLANNFDENIEFISREVLSTYLGSKRYFDGYIYNENFHIHPLNYLRALTKQIQNNGGIIYEDSEVVGVKEFDSHLVIKTANGSVKADNVVFCGSAYFKTSWHGKQKKLQRACLPIRTYVIKTEPVENDLLQSAIKVPYAIRDNRWADDYYRVLPDNSILWGGRCGLGEEPKNLESLMLSDMKHIYPQLADVKAEVTWSGLMGYTVHKMPHIGRFSEKAWYCTNFGGCGVGPTTMGGNLIASAITEGDERFKLFEPYGFSYTGGPLGPIVAQGVYHSWELADKVREFKYKKKAVN